MNEYVACERCDFGKGDYIEERYCVDKVLGEGTFGRVYRVRGVDGKNCSDKERMYLEALKEHTVNVYYSKVYQDDLRKIPSLSIGYWVSKDALSTFDNIKIGSIGEPRSGIMSGKTELFIRLWHEVANSNIGFNCFSNKDIKLSWIRCCNKTYGRKIRFRSFYTNYLI